MLSQIKAVIFDLDGTLVDSMGLWKDIDIEFLGERGIAYEDDLQEKIEGMSFTETAVYFKEYYHLDESVEELKKIWNQMAEYKYRYEVLPKPGVIEFLDTLKKKKIKYEYTEIDGCGSIDFLFRGLKFHVWEYEDREWGAETNIYEAGRSQDIEGDYEEAIAKEILSWPDMLPGS